MELIVISAPHKIAAEHSYVHQLFEAGLSLLHLRKPDWELRELDAWIAEIDPVYRARLVLHQCHELASVYGITRLHYTEAHRRRLNMQEWPQGEVTRSTSIHDLSALRSLRGFEYCFFGPVFDSLSKPGYQGRVGIDFSIPVGEGIKIIALGGIDPNNIHLIRQMNFDGAAVLGALWNKPETAVENYNTLKQKIGW